MGMNAESRPSRAAEETTGGKSGISLNAGSDITLEDRHAAFVAGFELGTAQRIEDEIEPQVPAACTQRTPGPRGPR